MCLRDRRPARTLPDSACVRAFFVSLLHTVDDWTQRTAAEIESWTDLELSDEKRDRAIERIRRLTTLPPVDSGTGVAKPPERQMRTRP